VLLGKGTCDGQRLTSKTLISPRFVSVSQSYRSKTTEIHWSRHRSKVQTFIGIVIGDGVPWIIWRRSTDDEVFKDSKSLLLVVAYIFSSYLPLQFSTVHQLRKCCISSHEFKSVKNAWSSERDGNWSRLWNFYGCEEWLTCSHVSTLDLSQGHWNLAG
jgi:hypothetical protein